MLNDLQLEYFVINETTLDDSFPSAQFAIENYEIRGRRDRDGHVGGLIKFEIRGIVWNCDFGINLFGNYHFFLEMVLYGHL